MSCRTPLSLGVLCAALVAGAAAVPSAVAAAETTLAKVQGAWLEQSLACKMVFAASGKGLSFKQPASAFAPAFIISGKSLRTPQATCSLRSARKQGDRIVISVGCANMISVGEVSAQFSLADDGSLIRYLNTEDLTGSRYQRCTAKDLQAEQLSARP